MVFAVLLAGGYLIDKNKPPIPGAVKDPDGNVLYGAKDVLAGQNYYFSRGGQHIGSIWGHGSYLAPDWSAGTQRPDKDYTYTSNWPFDPLGLLAVSAGDRIGMVGLFAGLIEPIKKAGGQLVVIEKNEKLIQKFPDLPITLDATELSTCNKILCTSTTILNHSLDEILAYCSPDAFVSIIGPTAGYFPDPLFARGVDIVAGRVVKNGALFLKLLAERKPWGDATQRTCFQKETYRGII